MMISWIHIILKRSRSPKGFGIIEALAVILLVGIVGLGLTKDMNGNLKSGQSFRIREAAESLVRSQMEIYSMVNPNTLSTASQTETNLTYTNLGPSYTFDRVTAIISSATIVRLTVTVTSKHTLFPMTYSGSVDFAKW